MPLLSKIKNPSKKVVFSVIIFIVIVCGFGYYYKSNINKKTDSVTKGPNTVDPVNYGPATEQEKQETKNNKDAFFNKQEEIKNQEKPTTANKVTVSPIITSANQKNDVVEVGAYIPGIFEDNGACNAVFTMGTQTITKTTRGVKEGSSVYCPLITVPVSEFPSRGMWSVKLNYVSDYYSGLSKPSDVSVK